MMMMMMMVVGEGGWQLMVGIKLKTDWLMLICHHEGKVKGRIIMIIMGLQKAMMMMMMMMTMMMMMMMMMGITSSMITKMILWIKRK